MPSPVLGCLCRRIRVCTAPPGTVVAADTLRDAGGSVSGATRARGRCSGWARVGRYPPGPASSAAPFHQKRPTLPSQRPAGTSSNHTGGLRRPLGTPAGTPWGKWLLTSARRGTQTRGGASRTWVSGDVGRTAWVVLDKAAPFPRLSGAGHTRVKTGCSSPGGLCSRRPSPRCRSTSSGLDGQVQDIRGEVWGHEPRTALLRLSESPRGGRRGRPGHVLLPPWSGVGVSCRG